MSLICIDNGSLNVRLGFQNNERPYINLHNKGIALAMPNILNSSKKYMVGQYCDFLGKDNYIEYPIHQGKIKNWDLMYEIWD